jgi:hypothetical protein
VSAPFARVFDEIARTRRVWFSDAARMIEKHDPQSVGGHAGGKSFGRVEGVVVSLCVLELAATTFPAG